jgi:outer membrane protein assembly factor BamA
MPMTNPFRIHDRIALTMVCLVVALCAHSASVVAQETSPASEQQESPKAADERQAGNPALPTGKMVRAFSWVESKIDVRSGVRDGWYPEMGNMIPGAGFSAGLGYRHRLFGDQAIADASAAVSWNGSRTLQSQLTWPRLVNDRLSIGGQLTYQDFTQINFFGIGSSSLESNQTTYRLKDVDAVGIVAVRPAPWLSLTGRVGALRRLTIEPGTSTVHPSIETRFDEGVAPGLAEAPNYLHAEVALDADTLDVPGNPSSGGRYRLSMAMFHDQDGSHHSFRRVEAEAAQYLPLGRTVLALRGRLGLSEAGAGQAVPFYMLPSLGGSNSLRGFLDYRFRDQDAMLMDAEYRLPILRRVDAAVFYDAGTVAPTASGLAGDLKSDYGVGIRVHSATHVLVRLDVARGSEGTRALVTFSGPLSLRNSRTAAPFVP